MPPHHGAPVVGTTESCPQKRDSLEVMLAFLSRKKKGHQETSGGDGSARCLALMGSQVRTIQSCSVLGLL